MQLVDPLRAERDAIVETLLARETAAGRVRGLDPEPAARALIGMNLQYFFDALVGVKDPDVDAAAATLLVLWTRALFGAPD